MNELGTLRAAIAHHWFAYMRGGEKVAEAVASSVGRGRVVHHAGLRADSLPNGRYTLSVEVRDRAGNKVASRSKDLEIRHGTFNLGSDVDLAVAMLTYIASGSEIDRFEKASGDERKGLWEEFWRERDPTPGTPRNEFLEEHERRFRYANERFGVALTDGWRTDRGRIFILYGEPDQVDSYPFEVGRKPTEVWYYFSGGRRFVFVDETGFGDYVLVGSGG
jgi:GWxTD domain-containing protein